jgi:hypothetical protein
VNEIKKTEHPKRVCTRQVKKTKPQKTQGSKKLECEYFGVKKDKRIKELNQASAS